MSFENRKMKNDRVSIITPSYEKHIDQYSYMIESIKKYCVDINMIDFVVVIEGKNRKLFEDVFVKNGIKSYYLVETENILRDLNISDSVSNFLKRVGKFTFQTVKKLGAFKYIKTDWSLILDSEGVFLKHFSVLDLFNEYKEKKYIFYTDTFSRGDLWFNSLGHQVNRNVSSSLDFDITDSWFMECFHWFYETKKVQEFFDKYKDSLFFSYISSEKREHDRFRYEGKFVDFFENILYYAFLKKHYSDEYVFYNLENELASSLPEEIFSRFKLNELPFSLFGNDYILNIFSPNELHFLKPFLEKFKLPFLRLEPPFFSSGFLPALEALPYLTATISSHHAIWLRKKIAVCISGEFRHKIHRVPEQQVRMLQSFLSGVECDIFIHGWHSTSEALILETLKPKKYLFEDRKDFSKLEQKIRYREPRLKADRDVGSLSMFYSLQESFNLIENNDDYDFVVRIRPDIFPDVSLKEILVRMTDVGDFVKDSIYFPKNYHSKGINDQLAIGSMQCMSVYFRTFNFIKKNISNVFFNPESLLLKNILAYGIKPVLVDAPYALMRELPMKICEIARVLHEQEGVWWSKTDDLPVSQDLSLYFSEKLASMELIMLEKFPEKFFIFHSKSPFKKEWLEIVNFDNNPSLSVVLIQQKMLSLLVSPYSGSDILWHEPFSEEDKKFFYKERNKYVLSFWKKRGDTFYNKKLYIDPKNVIFDQPILEKKIHKAWERYHRYLAFMNKENKLYRRLLRFKPLGVRVFLFILYVVNSKSRRRKLALETDKFCSDSKLYFIRKFGRKYLK